MQQWDSAQVEERLAQAGRALMALHVSGIRPAGVRSNMPPIVREACEAYGYTAADLPPAPPSAREIAAMDQALSWLGLIPGDRIVLRRIVGARMLHRPKGDKPMFSWRRIGEQVGASHVAVQTWHRQAIDMIVVALNRPGWCAAAGGPVGPGPDQVELWARRAMVRARRKEKARELV